MPSIRTRIVARWLGRQRWWHVFVAALVHAAFWLQTGDVMEIRRNPPPKWPSAKKAPSKIAQEATGQPRSTFGPSENGPFSPRP